MQLSIYFILALLACVYGIIYVITNARSRAKHAFYDKGVDPRVILVKTATSSRYKALKKGLLLIFLALCLIIGNMLIKYTRVEETVVNFSMIALIVGTIILLYHMPLKKIL